MIKQAWFSALKAGASAIGGRMSASAMEAAKGMKAGFMGASKGVPSASKVVPPKDTTMMVARNSYSNGGAVGRAAANTNLVKGFSGLKKTTFDPANKINSVKGYVREKSNALKQIGTGTVNTVGAIGAASYLGNKMT
jgi:hypothetical protein